MNREQLIQDLLSRFRAVFHGVKSGTRFPLSTDDLSSGEMTIMVRLGQHPAGISVKDLAAEMGITSGGVTQLVDKLVEKDLACRSEDPIDRRIVQVAPSTKAVAMHADFKQQFHDRMSVVFSSLSNNDLAQLIGLLNKVTVDQSTKDITH